MNDPLLRHLGEVAREAREKAGVKQVRVAANLEVNQETISRFERGRAWPRNPERFVAAYAQEVHANALELWEEALRRWRASA